MADINKDTKPTTTSKSEDPTTTQAPAPSPAPAPTSPTVPASASTTKDEVINVPTAPLEVPRKSFFGSTLQSISSKTHDVLAAGRALVGGGVKTEIVEAHHQAPGASETTQVVQISTERDKQDPDKPEAHEIGEDREEKCLLFPTYATLERCEGKEPAWNVKIQGWAFSSGKLTSTETIILDAARYAAQVKQGSSSNEILERNAGYFFTKSVKDTPFLMEAVGLTDVDKMEISGSDAEYGELLENKGGEHPSIVVNSGGGHFDGVLKVPASILENITKDRGAKLLKIKASQDKLDKPAYGVVVLIDDSEGISVVSDIDDTIKITGILDGFEKVFANTFLKAPNPVEGMAEAYEHFGAKGIPVHYVSNGPWQLFPMLSAFFRESRFPSGSSHLRLFDWRTARAVPGQHKLTVISELMKEFPKRKYVLIGDTGELDPEVYTKIARLYPDRVLKIFIHDVTTSKVQFLPPMPHRRYTLKVAEDKIEHVFSLLKLTDEGNDGLQPSENEADLLKSPLEVFHERIQTLTEGLPPALFTLFTDPNVIIQDEVIRKAIPGI